MSDRDALVGIIISHVGANWTQEAPALADAILAADPLRLALREPSDELIERILWRCGWIDARTVRAVLGTAAALAGAVTPDGK